MKYVVVETQFGNEKAQLRVVPENILPTFKKAFSNFSIKELTQGLDLKDASEFIKNYYQKKQTSNKNANKKSGSK